MFNQILFVCVGNICRSPMAEGIFKDWLTKNNIPTLATSAGLAAVVNKPATKTAKSLLEKRNIDISHHIARQLNDDMVREVDLILTMERAHKKKIEEMYPYTYGKVFLLGKWENVEIPDPYGGGLTDYEKSLKLIDQGLISWQKKIC